MNTGGKWDFVGKILTGGNETISINIYTLVHLGFGMLARLMGVPFLPWTAIHSLFEVLENSNPGIRFFKEKNGWLKRNLGISWPEYTGDTVINSIIDTAAALLGWAIMDRFMKK